MPKQKASCYDDILNLPHHQSESRAKLSASDRAAQFSAFEALSGHASSEEELAALAAEKVAQEAGRLGAKKK